MDAIVLDGEFFPAMSREACPATPDTWQEVTIEAYTTELVLRNPVSSSTNLYYSTDQELVGGASVTTATDNYDELAVGEFFNFSRFLGQVTGKKAITKFFVGSSAADAEFVVVWGVQQVRQIVQGA